MRKQALYTHALTLTVLIASTQTNAQNTSPYWSLAGNSNATTASKLGTTNGINLRLYTNNVERVRILSTNGYVGIGTTTPTERLHINSPSGVGALRAQVNGNTKLLVHSGGGVAIGGNVVPPANGLYVSGNVGLGTTTPSNKLHVVGSGRFTNGLVVNNGGLNAANTAGPGVSATGSDNGVVGITTADTYPYAGAYGYSSAALGVFGQSSDNIGVYGVSSSFTGVNGQSSSGVGVAGGSSDGIGVAGSSYSSFGGDFYSDQSFGLVSRTFSGYYAGVFYGAVYASEGFVTSDKNLKQNVQEFSSAMSLIGKLKPRQYEFKRDGQYAFLNLAKGSHYGLMAQDVEEVLPNLVSTTDHKVRTPVKRNADGTLASSMPQKGVNEKPETMSIKAVNYIELIPIVIKGMQEQEEKIQKQDQLIEKLLQQVEKLESQVSKLSGSNTVTVTGVGTLNQATPNPAVASTRISYSLPQGSSRGQLLLTDASGKTVKALSLNNSGYVNQNTTGLSSGIYNYSLIVDGKLVETKKLEVVRN